LSKGAISYKDFVNKELLAFSHYDTVRSIPSVVDGLKPSQRKVRIMLYYFVLFELKKIFL